MVGRADRERTMRRYTLLSGVTSGFMVIDMQTGNSLGWYPTRYQAEKARKAAERG